MKVKYLLASLLAIVFFSCDDTTDALGLNMMPNSDKVDVKAMNFDVSTQTVLAGPVFAKTSMGFLGKYTDPEFGSFDADFLAQVTCTDQFEFPLARMVPVDNNSSEKTFEATAASINFYYTRYFGDSLNTCRLSVYELNKELVKSTQSYYTDIDPSQYYSTSGLLAKKSYSAVDLSVDEATRYSSTYYPSVSVNFPLNRANQFIKLFQDSKANGLNFKDEFAKAFKGIYVKCDQGDGTVLYLDQVHLNISFKVYATDSLGHFPIKRKQAGFQTEDSTYITTAQFGSTKEVIQTNRFINDQKLSDLAQIKDYTMIKSPAGLFTKVTLPIAEIANKLKNDTLNSVKLSFNAYNKNSVNSFGMSAPKQLLIVRESDYKDFFEKNLLIDNITSFLASYSASTNEYTFSNITRLITTAMTENKETEEMLLIPVTVTLDSNSNIISIQHDLEPGYVKLKGGTDNKLKLEIKYISFK